jgi:ATP-dependent exoDNAse (exonuclease V) alpha subunit
MISYWYSCDISDDIFNKFDEDEIILCLNYDGIYWINNLNLILQQNNKNPSIQWWVNTYKIWDPVLFNESYRFWDTLHNNLKWVITNIEVKKDKVYFTLDVKKEINILDATFNWIEVLEEFNNWKTTIKFYVNKLESTDEDKNDSKNIVPFQVSYAVSIHKSQWLEYNSVKIVISEDIDELITHNIFYTAITRARKNLKIYWSPKTSKLILETISHNENSTDSYILKNKFNL